MKHLTISNPSQWLIPESWFMHGQGITNSEKRIRHLVSVFDDKAAMLSMDPDAIVYQVQSHLPVAENTPGGLFFGTTTVHPGMVGDEYFMTRGHFHSISDRGEYYWCVSGTGMLIMMGTKRVTWAEKMFRGSLHYIGKEIAHRVANTGIVPLIFGACWPADAGHDYVSIDREGFSARLKERNGIPCLVGT
jgi:glucose-6-phosphate isomerase, archaeal